LTLTLKADRAGDGWLKADNAGDAVGFSAGDAFGFAATPGLQKHAVRPHTAHTTAVAFPDSASNVIFEKPFIGRWCGFVFPMIVFCIECESVNRIRMYAGPVSWVSNSKHWL
jgi:hypothetical protein